MYILQADFSFEASHQLPHHDGKCSKLHGHSWKGIAFVASIVTHQEGPKQGMVIDYADIKAPIKALVETQLDHSHLNLSLGMESPTSEMLTRWIFHELVPKIPGLVAIQIEETCTARCTYMRWPDMYFEYAKLAVAGVIVR